MRFHEMWHQQFLGLALGLGKGAPGIVTPQRQELVERRDRLDDQGAERPFHLEAARELPIQRRPHVPCACRQIAQVDGGAGSGNQGGAEEILLQVGRVGLQDALVTLVQMHLV